MYCLNYFIYTFFRSILGIVQFVKPLNFQEAVEVVAGNVHNSFDSQRTKAISCIDLCIIGKDSEGRNGWGLKEPALRGIIVDVESGILDELIMDALIKGEGKEEGENDSFHC